MPPPREWPRLLLQAGKDAIADEVPMLASAIAFNAFLAIPATLLLVVGFFSLVADPGVISDLMEKVGTVVPAEAVTLVEDSLLQLEQKPSSGILMTVVGFLLALWTATGAVNTLMTAVNRAHELDDERGFLRKRAIAALLVVALGLAVLVVTAFLVLRAAHTALDRRGARRRAHRLVDLVDCSVADPADRPLRVLRDRLRPGDEPPEPALAVHLARGRCRRRSLAPGIGWICLLRLPLRFVQQDLGLALGGDRDPCLALSLGNRAALRSGGERGGRTRGSGRGAVGRQRYRRANFRIAASSRAVTGGVGTRLTVEYASLRR